MSKPAPASMTGSCDLLYDKQVAICMECSSGKFAFPVISTMHFLSTMTVPDRIAISQYSFSISAYTTIVKVPVSVPQTSLDLNETSAQLPGPPLVSCCALCQAEALAASDALLAPKLPVPPILLQDLQLSPESNMIVLC